MSRAVFLRANELPTKIDVVRQERAIAQATPTATAELTSHGRNLRLWSSVVVPGALNSRAVDHLEFAEQSSRFAPLATKTVQEAVRVGFFGSEETVLVPDANNAVPLTAS